MARNGRENGGREDLGYEENGKIFTFSYFLQVRLNQLNIKVLTRKRLLKLHRQVAN